MQNIVPLGNLESLRQSIKTNDSRMSRIDQALNTESGEHSGRHAKRTAQVAFTDQKTREDEMRIFSPVSSMAERKSPKEYGYYKPDKIKVQKMNIESAMDTNDYIMDFGKNFEKSDEAEVPVYGTLTAPTAKATWSPTGTNPLDDPFVQDSGAS